MNSYIKANKTHAIALFNWVEANPNSTQDAMVIHLLESDFEEAERLVQEMIDDGAFTPNS
jgi:pentatricopeptide repeat protein